MSDMNSALSVWQLTIMAVVPTAALVGWLIAIFIAAREPRGRAAAAGATGAGAAGDRIVSALAMPDGAAAGADVAGQDEPAEPPDRRQAA
jgi:hypothetical protein